MIERIRAVLPKELLIEEGCVNTAEGFPSPTVGQIYSFRRLVDGKAVQDEDFKVMFLVKYRRQVEDVSLGRGGSINMGVMVQQLLDGLLPGYEHLGEKNPFRTP
jgi:hypothetical protein